MFIECLTSRLSQGIEDLAKMLNLLHKLKSKQRQVYFLKIKSIKDQLISLKNNLKQSNALQTQRTYNSLFLTISSLTSEIKDQINIKNNKDNKDLQKQNRDINRSITIRQNNNNYDDALRLIAQKQEELNQLKLTLFQKQELISMTYQQLRDFKRDNSMFSQQTKMMKVDLNNLERELSMANGELRKKEEEVIDLQLEAQDRQRELRIVIEDLQNCKTELVGVKEQVNYYSQLAQISMNKARVIEQNIRQVQIDAKYLNENYLSKEAENLHKNKTIQELSFRLKNCEQNNNILKDENCQIKEDIQAIEEQMIKMQRRLFQQKQRYKQDKTKLQKQLEQIQCKYFELSQSYQKQKMQNEQTENKFMQMYQKYQTSQTVNQQLNNVISGLNRQKDRKDQQVLSRQNEIRIHEKQLLFCKKENTILKEQVEKSMKISKDYEIEIQKLKQIIKTKDQQRLKLISSLQSNNNQLKTYERDRNIFDRSLSSLNEEVKDCKTMILKLQQINKSYRREIDLLKIRLFRAKIEAIHQIRENIRQS